MREFAEWLAFNSRKRKSMNDRKSMKELVDIDTSVHQTTATATD